MAELENLTAYVPCKVSKSLFDLYIVKVLDYFGKEHIFEVDEKAVKIKREKDIGKDIEGEVIVTLVEMKYGKALVNIPGGELDNKILVDYENLNIYS